ncbi:polyprenyl synthetase family protein [Microbacterium sp. NPDC096154]|uniref:polyprenyl synthetase family protein n=1 Tax=Microbacterium sp. NPDC096154 TaxID=3155549 RepID=UPI00332F29AA
MRTGEGRAAVADCDALLEEFFAERIASAARLDPSYEALWSALAESMRGGKRLRPRLLLAAHGALGGVEGTAEVHAAAAFELLHTALLVHDDVLDGDVMRRGRPNLPGRFTDHGRERGLSERSARAWGRASGVLAGDLLLSAVYAFVGRVASPARPALHAIIDECLFVTAAGEHADISFGLGVRPAREADIVRMMRHKTAIYSFAAPLRAGAVLAGASEGSQDALSRIGEQLGLLYQLRDDMLGVFGDERHTGKSIEGDLREGKRTLLVALAEGHPQWLAVRHLFGSETLDREGAARLRDALVSSGARDRAETLIRRQREQLSRRIEVAPLPLALREHLAVLADTCVERVA